MYEGNEKDATNMNELPSPGPRRPKLPQHRKDADASSAPEEPVMEHTDELPVPTPGKPSPHQDGQASEAPDATPIDDPKDSVPRPGRSKGQAQSSAHPNNGITNQRRVSRVSQ